MLDEAGEPSAVDIKPGVITSYEVTGPIVRIKTPTDRALESLPVEF